MTTDERVVERPASFDPQQPARVLSRHEIEEWWRQDDQDYLPPAKREVLRIRVAGLQVAVMLRTGGPLPIGQVHHD